MNAKIGEDIDEIAVQFNNDCFCLSLLLAIT